MARFGVGAVRGSSTRGGTRALRTMIAATRETNMAITPDGPVGPGTRVKEEWSPWPRSRATCLLGLLELGSRLELQELGSIHAAQALRPLRFHATGP